MKILRRQFKSSGRKAARSGEVPRALSRGELGELEPSPVPHCVLDASSAGSSIEGRVQPTAAIAAVRSLRLQATKGV
jgi:hypothetical protein